VFVTGTRVIGPGHGSSHMAVAAAVVGTTPSTAGGVAFFFGKGGV
jgi:hypothetical protein